MKCPNCGKEEFIAHQVIHADIVVDGSNMFLRNMEGGLESAIYYSGTPFGPYTCTACGHEVDELK